MGLGLSVARIEARVPLKERETMMEHPDCVIGAKGGR